MLALELPLILLLLAPPGAGAFLEALAAKNISQKEAEFDKSYTDFVNSELLNIYTFNHTVMRNRVSECPPSQAQRQPRGHSPSARAIGM